MDIKELVLRSKDYLKRNQQMIHIVLIAIFIIASFFIVNRDEINGFKLVTGKYYGFGEYCGISGAPYGDQCPANFPCQDIDGEMRCWCDQAIGEYERTVLNEPSRIACCSNECQYGYDDNNLPANWENLLDPNDPSFDPYNPSFCTCNPAPSEPICDETDTVDNLVCYSQTDAFGNPMGCELVEKNIYFCCEAVNIYGDPVCDPGDPTCELPMDIINWDRRWSNLIHYWRFNEYGMTLVGSDYFLKVHDEARHNHGIMDTGLWTKTDVPHGAALVFDGAGQSTSNVGDIVDEETQLTITTWVYPEAITGTDYFIGEGGAFRMGLIAPNNILCEFTGIDATDSPDINSFTMSIPVTIGSWNFVACVWDGVSGEIRMYLGPTEETQVSTVVRLDAGSNNGAIGDEYDGAGSYFQGTLDELIMFDRALSAADIQQIYDDYN